MLKSKKIVNRINNKDMKPASTPVKIELLADRPHLIDFVGELRWHQWGHAPEPVDRNWWVEVTTHEAGRDQLPVTWVAINGDGEVLGAVGLGKFDIEESQDRSPWILGLIVRPDSRGIGIGRLLLKHLGAWAKSRGVKQIWVANEGPALGFYQKCEWKLIEKVERTSGEPVFVLTKSL